MAIFGASHMGLFAGQTISPDAQTSKVSPTFKWRAPSKEVVAAGSLATIRQLFPKRLVSSIYWRSVSVYTSRIYRESGRGAAW